MNLQKALVWFRRDLRTDDHAALSAALRSADEVYCVFIFDRDILDALPTRQDRRVHFIHESLVELDSALRHRGGSLIVRHGRARDEIPKLAAELGVGGVFVNRDYEPSSKHRDAVVAQGLKEKGITFQLYKDQSIFDGSDVLTQSGTPFTVFTPYKNAWLKRLVDAELGSHDCTTGKFAAHARGGIPRLEEIGFEASDLASLGIKGGMSGARERWALFREERLQRYGALRDFPAIRGVSYLSVHLRFGTISIRELVRSALAEQADVWLSELIWRDFYFMILDRFPHVVTNAFKPEYDAIQWDDHPENFAAWCAGNTGYPLVDAAMRQLLFSGWMHNRLRMVSASFLSKDLGIDWRLGERYFAEKLIDFDLAANNGGWQWSASSGCDAQPYFRIFNPITQSEKFDPDGRFIRRYLPALARVPDKFIHAPWKMSREMQESIGVVIGRDYPPPLVDHAIARQRTLLRYACIKKQ